MAGGVLMVSRAVNLFPYWIKEFEKFGFKNLLFTTEEKDSLNSVIDEFKPRILIIGSGFYQSATPYMMKQLLKIYPHLNIAAVNIHEFPDDIAAWFIYYGVKSYVNMMDGMEEFYKGMRVVRDGGKYISPAVLERMNLRDEEPKLNGNLTKRHIEIIRLVCNGFKDNEVADVLHISRRTVDTHKTSIFTMFCVRNPIELYKAIEKLNIIKLDEANFYPKDMVVNPVPNNKEQRKKNNEKKDKNKCA